MASKKYSRKAPTPVSLSTIRQNFILINPDGIRCRIDRIESGTVYMTVQGDKTINGETEIAVSTDEVVAHWTLPTGNRHKKAA